ncbi:acetylcholinesterase-1-like [Dermacentor andersoni]|uniref:acetylcholinesterase-1-like n=1 Tax=Dermacentor andersoni TaxID=34620 RepID=UPI003B3BBD8F
MGSELSTGSVIALSIPVEVVRIAVLSSGSSPLTSGWPNGRVSLLALGWWFPSQEEVVAALLSGCLITALAVFVLLPVVSRSGTKAPRGCLIARTANGYAKGSLLQFKINGTSYNSVAFYGIPFGASTTGDGRFAEPRCAQPWHDLFNATYKRPPCAQSDTHFGRTYFIDASNTTEDCLHINVWVPGKCVTDLLGGENHRAVVFWLFGGSFVGGGNSYDFYDGRFVAGLGDVLVVTPNYRVTSFGFLNSGTGREVAGNMGLYDQLLALRWLRENVHWFGGDRDRILIAGQSAGAIASSMLMASPIMSQYGPYSRAFLMSGSAYVPLPPNKGPNAGWSFSRLASNAGCQSARVADAVHCLRNRSAPDILKATKNISLFFMPSFEAPLFPGKMDSLERRFVAARARDTLISNVAMEGEAFFQMLMPHIAGTQKKITAQVLKQTFPYLFGDASDSVMELVIPFLKTVYDLEAPNHRGWIQVIGDTMFRCPVASFGKSLATLGKNVYYLQYTPRPSFSPFPGENATHGDDVPMLFGLPYTYPHLATDEDRAMSYRMITMVSSFAKDGSLPSLEDGSPWPLFSKASNYSFVDLAHSGFTLGGTTPECPLLEIMRMILNPDKSDRRAIDSAWTPEVVSLALDMLAAIPARALEIAATTHAHAYKGQ